MSFGFFDRFFNRPTGFKPGEYGRIYSRLLATPSNCHFLAIDRHAKHGNEVQIVGVQPHTNKPVAKFQVDRRTLTIEAIEEVVPCETAVPTAPALVG